MDTPITFFIVFNDLSSRIGFPIRGSQEELQVIHPSAQDTCNALRGDFAKRRIISFRYG